MRQLYGSFLIYLLIYHLCAYFLFFITKFYLYKLRETPCNIKALKNQIHLLDKFRKLGFNEKIKIFKNIINRQIAPFKLIEKLSIISIMQTLDPKRISDITLSSLFRVPM